MNQLLEVKDMFDEIAVYRLNDEGSPPALMPDVNKQISKQPPEIDRITNRCEYVIFLASGKRFQTAPEKSSEWHSR